MTDPIPLLSSVANGALVAALVAASLAACVDTTGPPFPRIEETEFAPSLDIDLSEMRRIDGGIYVLDLTVGTGATLRASEAVHVAYTLRLADGTLVDQRDEFKFRSGCWEIIPGMEAGMVGMKVGGLRKIIVPGRWGFGPEPPWGIEVPYGAILVYDIEALRAYHIDDCDTPI